MKVEDKEMAKIDGGENITGNFLNYLSSAIKTVYNIGHSFGGAIRRIATGNVCPF